MVVLSSRAVAQETEETTRPARAEPTRALVARALVAKVQAEKALVEPQQVEEPAQAVRWALEAREPAAQALAGQT